MKVVYRKPIRQQLAEAIRKARSEGKTIDRIELSPAEWVEFRADYAYEIHLPRLFMDQLLCLESTDKT